jgi:hypothetical protein
MSRMNALWGRYMLTAGRMVVVAGWIAVVAMLMVTDVWDESRGLELFHSADLGDLLRSNWKQDAGQGLVLFRPLPFFLFNAFALAVGDPELTWRGLRVLNACLVVASAIMLLGVVRRRAGAEPIRDLIIWTAMLASGSAVITASWFANGFDAMALFFIAVSIDLLDRERGLLAGLALGTAFFCKEVALLGLVFLALLGRLGIGGKRQVARALSVAIAALGVYLILRSAVVAPGSESDLRTLSLAGAFDGVARLPVTIWWQVADVPFPSIGAAAFAASLILLRSWRAVGTITVWYLAIAVLYGPILPLGPEPLISSGNFAGRLYLVPSMLALTLIGLCGRRYSAFLLLVPLLWGAAITVERHHRFQESYRAIYDQAATVKKPLFVDCEFYDRPFAHRYRGVVFGRLPEASWIFTSDGMLRRRDPFPPSVGTPSRPPD